MRRPPGAGLGKLGLSTPSAGQRRRPERSRRRIRSARPPTWVADPIQRRALGAICTAIKNACPAGPFTHENHPCSNIQGTRMRRRVLARLYSPASPRARRRCRRRRRLPLRPPPSTPVDGRLACVNPHQVERARRSAAAHTAPLASHATGELRQHPAASAVDHNWLGPSTCLETAFT
jgi:hypothetical protein